MSVEFELSMCITCPTKKKKKKGNEKPSKEGSNLAWNTVKGFVWILDCAGEGLRGKG